MTFRRRLSALFYELDKTCATLGAVVSTCCVIFLLTYQKNLGYLPIHLFLFAFLVMCSCIFWLVFRKENLSTFSPSPSEPRVKLWALCFFILYTLSVVAIYFRSSLYERPLVYFVLTILMAGIIACEVCTAERRHVGLILIQIFLLGISLNASLSLIVPSLIGGDPWYHYDLTTRILNSHYIPHGDMYSTMPFFHLTIAVTSIITTLPYKFSTLVSVSFGQIVINSIFIFLIADYLFKNHRIGLLSALLVVIGDENIIRSIAPIPNSFGYIFILIVIYLIFTKFRGTYKFPTYVLLILSMGSTILVHSIPALIVTICLFTIWVSYYYLKFFPLQKTQKTQYITLLVPLGFFLAMLSWWYYVGTQAADATRILAEALNLDVTSFSPIPDITANAIVADTMEVIFINFGLYIFICLSLVGLFYMISRRGNNLTFCFALISVIPLTIYICTYSLGGLVYDATFNILPGRWINLIQILMCVPSALCIYLIGKDKIRSVDCRSLFFGGLIMVLSLFMMMTPSGSPDNHTLTPSKQYWSYYTDSEMSGNDFFANKSIGILSSDRNHAIHTSSSVFQHVYGIDRDRLRMLDFEIQSGIFEPDDSIKIFRYKRILEFQRVGVFSSIVQPDLNTYMSRCGFDKIYESPTMTGYTNA